MIFLFDSATHRILDANAFTARALGHSIFTEADTWEELRQAVRDAVQCHFDPGSQPQIIRLHAVREEILAT